MMRRLVLQKMMMIMMKNELLQVKHVQWLSEEFCFTTCQFSRKELNPRSFLASMSDDFARGSSIATLGWGPVINHQADDIMS